ncbi:MAG: AbrB/MazE/SpoVT family DNA-binding domain-containing protein [Candidatus Humimicrobiaceae bacterium]
MKTTVTKRGQTSVPSEIIKKYDLKKGSKLYWLDTGFFAEKIYEN